MTRTVLLVASLTLFLGSASNAAVTVLSNTLAGGAEKKFVASSAGELLTSGWVRVGYFLDPSGDADIISSRNAQAIDAIFRPLGEDAITGHGSSAANTISVGTPSAGNFGGQIADDIEVNANPEQGVPVGSRLYLWVLDGMSVGESGEHLLVSATDINWAFPNDNATANLAAFQINDAPSEVFAGSIVGNQLRLEENIPEPSTSLLGLLGAFGLLLRRRR